MVAGTNSNSESGLAGATITAGQVVYKDATTNKYLLADSDSVVAGAAAPTGIALNGASLNQPLKVLKSGDITIGAVLVAGTAYYLSDDTPGGICPLADVGSGDTVVLIGVAKSTTVLYVLMFVAGVTL